MDWIEVNGVSLRLAAADQLTVVHRLRRWLDVSGDGGGTRGTGKGLAVRGGEGRESRVKSRPPSLALDS